MQIRAIYPISAPFSIDSDIIHENYRDLVEYLSSGREIRIRGDDFHQGEKLVARSKRFTKAQQRQSTSRFLLQPDWCVEFSGSFKFPGPKKFNLKDSKGQIIETPVAELRAVWRDFLPHFLDLTIQTYLLALTFSFPGAVEPVGSLWTVGGKQHRHSRYYTSPVREALGFLNEQNFRPGYAVTPSEAIDWVFKSNGIFDGYSNSPASRSLNFFTRLFVEQERVDELSDLVWAVAGIEAILVEGGRSSLGQLREKLAAIFRDRADTKWLSKWISDVYSFRSRMLHGDRQIKSAFRADEDVDSRFQEEYDSRLFAVGLLLVLLQEMIIKQCSRLEFLTVIAPSPTG